MAKNYPYRCQINYFGIATRNPSGSPTKWCPRSIAKLVNITPITMVYGTQITIVIVTGVYKPTYNLGGTTLKIWGFPWGKPMAMGISQASLGWLKISMGKYPTKMIF